MSLVTTQGIMLRSSPYSETSQILRFFTRDMGGVAVIAKGVRKTGGRSGGALSTWAEGSLSFFFKRNRDLHTFRDFSPSRNRRGLARDPLRFAGAAVLGELVLQHADTDPNPEVYSCLVTGLDSLELAAGENLLASLLSGVWTLVSVMGYAPSIRRCMECGREPDPDELAQFDLAEGGIRCSRCQAKGGRGRRLGPVARRQLLGMVEGSLEERLIRPFAHLRLAGDFITYHLSGGTPLRSIGVLEKLIPEEDA